MRIVIDTGIMKRRAVDAVTGIFAKPEERESREFALWVKTGKVGRHLPVAPNEKLGMTVRMPRSFTDEVLEGVRKRSVFFELGDASMLAERGRHDLYLENRIPINDLLDEDVNVMQVLADANGNGITFCIDSAIVKAQGGTGTPVGLLAAGIPTMNAGEINAASISDLMNTLPAEFGAGTVFLVSKETEQRLVGMTDAQGIIIYNDGRLYGRRVIVNPDLTDDTVIYGNFRRAVKIGIGEMSAGRKLYNVDFRNGNAVEVAKEPAMLTGIIAAINLDISIAEPGALMMLKRV